MTPVLITGILCILLVEWTLWIFFRRRIAGLLFSHQADTSSLRFFTLTRLRLCALAHTVFLLAVFILSLLFLW